MAGVNGLLFLAVLEAHSELLGVPAGNPKPRLEPSHGLSEAHGIADLKGRLRQELAAASVAAVGLVETRQRNNWLHGYAYQRITAVSAVVVATTELGTEFKTLAAEAI